MQATYVSRLQHFRFARGLTQAALGKKAGISRQSIWTIEHGRPARMLTIYKLAEALGVDPSELVGAKPQEES